LQSKLLLFAVFAWLGPSRRAVGGRDKTRVAPSAAPAFGDQDALSLDREISQLAQDLPTYETNLRDKIRTLGAGKLTSGALDRASATLKDLQEEISKAGTPVASGQKPMLVEVRQPTKPPSTMPRTRRRGQLSRMIC